MNEENMTIVHVTQGTGYISVYKGNGNTELIKEIIGKHPDLKKFPSEKGYMSQEKMAAVFKDIITEAIPEESGKIEVRVY